MKKNKLGNILCIVLSIFVLASCSNGIGNEVEVDNQLILSTENETKIEFTYSSIQNGEIDFTEYEGVPFIKKVSQFVIGTDKLSNVSRDVSKYLKDLRPDVVRYPMAIYKDEIGANGFNVKASVKSSLNTISTVFSRGGICADYWYTAEAQPAYDRERYPGLGDDKLRFCPPDVEKYAEVFRIAAEYCAAQQHRTYWEVLNECDHNGWWSGDWQDYINTYVGASKGLRSGDPYATVGGLSTSGIERALGVERLNDFLNAVISNSCPIDFVSYHDYFDLYISESETIANALDQNSYFDKTQMHFNEFNVAWRNDYQQEVKSDNFIWSAGMVPKMLNALDYLTNNTAITLIHWATFCDNGYDDGFGLLDFEGNPMITYYVLKLFQNMPYTRVKTSSSNENVKVLASTDDSRSSAFIYNVSDNKQSVNINLNNVVGSKVNVNIYRLDENHGSYFDNKETAELKPIKTYKNVVSSEINISGDLPKNGAYYIEIDNGNVNNELDYRSVNSMGRVIRQDYYYQDRTKNVYADYDDATATEIIGMGSNDIGYAGNSLTLFGVKDTIKLDVNILTDIEVKSVNSTLGIRVDYMDNNGDYVKSIYYALEDFAQNLPTYPFGSTTASTSTSTLTIGENELDIKNNAPANWSGNIELGFVAIDAGSNMQCKIKFKE